MSLKKLSCFAAIAALVASPVWAQPTVSLTNTGLDANGDWVWEVDVVTPADGSVATELDATLSDAGLIGGGIAAGSIFDTPNPSTSSFGWVTPDGDGVVGYQENVPTSEATIGYGSSDEAAGSYALATFTTEGPSTTGSLTTSISIDGILAQLGANNTIATTAASRTATAGDADLVGGVATADLSILASNFGASGANWSMADFDGDDIVGTSDLSILASNFGAPSGGLSAAGSAAPEPSALILAGLAVLGIARRTRRS